MKDWKHVLRYVPQVDAPTLLGTFEQVLRERSQELAVSPRQLLNWYGISRRLPTLLAMLRHERPLWVADFLCVVSLTGLRYEEAEARYWANAPAPKVGEFARAMRQLDALTRARHRRPCFTVAVTAVQPTLVVVDRIYWPDNP